MRHGRVQAWMLPCFLTRFAAVLLLSGTALQPRAQEAAAESTQVTGASYTRTGADTCLKCHDEDSQYPVLDIFKTHHAQRADARTPFAQLQCESCHGPGGEHAKRLRRNETRPPIPRFGPHSFATAAEENGVCLGCHRQDVLGWNAGAHHDNQVLCVSCHTIHAVQDPVRETSRQPQVCFKCHPRQRADAQMASVHPIRYGQMACSDCHTPHASFTEHSLVANTVNETCYHCHAEKRGPFLWEHAPASEDCDLCHEPHGSNHKAMLKRPLPLLCQQCHSRLGHPSLAAGSENLPGRGGKFPEFLLSRGCTNCHSQIHGSNHPSGERLTR